MDSITLIELIPTLGFPIVCAIALSIFIFIIYKKSEQREDMLHKELKECREINREAISTIAKYAEKLDVIQKDISDIKIDITVIKSKD